MSIDFIKKYAPNLSPEALDYIKSTSKEYIKEYAQTTNNTEHISKLINHTNLDVVSAVAMNPNLTDINIDVLLDNCFDGVREIAAMHYKCSKENIDKALIDISSKVKIAAMNNAKYREYYPFGC